MYMNILSIRCFGQFVSFFLYAIRLRMRISSIGEGTTCVLWAFLHTANIARWMSRDTSRVSRDRAIMKTHLLFGLYALLVVSLVDKGRL